MYRIRHWIPHTELHIEGIYERDGELYVDIARDKLADWISQASLYYDIMLVRRKDDFQTMEIVVDDEGKRFRSR